VHGIVQDLAPDSNWRPIVMEQHGLYHSPLTDTGRDALIDALKTRDEFADAAILGIVDQFIEERLRKEHDEIKRLVKAHQIRFEATVNRAGLCEPASARDLKKHRKQGLSV